MSEGYIGIWNKTATIVQHNTNEYSPPLRGLYVMAAGDVKITTWDGVAEVWTCPAGFYIPRFIKIIWDTGTSVTDANLFSGTP